MEKVAIYLRKSREDLSSETLEETLARHERILLDYAKKNNFNVIKIYKEIKSGVMISSRPVIKELLRDVSLNKYDGVIVLELSRLSRGSLSDIEEILDTFSKSKTAIFTPSKKYNLALNNEKEEYLYDLDKKMYIINMVFSGFEYEMITKRLSRGRLLALQEGYFLNSKCAFGYKKEKKDRGFILMENDDSLIVKEIFEKYASKIKPRDIISWLNDITNIKWNNQKLNRLISNKVYLGLIKGKDEKGNVIYYQGRHQPLIDEVTFDKANYQKALHQRIEKNSDKILNPFLSILKCSCCGKAMYLKRIKNQMLFDCLTNRCHNISCSYDDIKERFIFDLKEILNENLIYLKKYQNIGLENEIKEKEEMLKNCYEYFEKKLYDYNTFNDRRIVLKKEIDELKELNFNIVKSKNIVSIIRTIIYQFHKLKSPKYQNIMLKKYIDKISYLKTKRAKKGEDGILNIHLDMHFIDKS